MGDLSRSELAAALNFRADQRFREWFEWRHWRVLTEVTGTREVPGDPPVTVTCERGRFEVAMPGAFRTPTGHRGRHGFLIQEVSASGADIPGSRAAFGEQSLRAAASRFGTVSGLPDTEMAEAVDAG